MRPNKWRGSLNADKTNNIASKFMGEEDGGMGRIPRRHSLLSFLMAFNLAAGAIPLVTRVLAQVAALEPSSATELPKVKIVSTKFGFFTPAQVRVAAGREVTLVLDNRLGGNRAQSCFACPWFSFCKPGASEISSKKHHLREARHI